MKERQKSINNTKTGLFVLAGLAFIILTLYMIGKNRDLLGKTFTVRAIVTNVNGLVPGNNVRFKGIDVGTVKSIEVSNDTAILLTLVIDESMKPYIRKNAIATIGTDGLMGNKLVNINSSPGKSPPLLETDTLFSLQPVETDEMLRTLNTTNDNISRISENLFQITTKLNRSESMWSLLSDTVITRDLKKAVTHFKSAGANTQAMTRAGVNLVSRLEDGNGLAFRVFTDTTYVADLDRSLRQIRMASQETATMMRDLNEVVENLKRGDGTAGLLLTDTVFRSALFRSARNVEEGTARFNENMEALRSNFLFRRYFKKRRDRTSDPANARNE